MFGLIGNFGPWEMIIVSILVLCILVAVLVRIVQRGNTGKVIIGILFIIIAIGANVGASALYTEGHETWLIHSASEGEQMMAIADGIKYSGIALGILGLVLVSLPLFSSVKNNNVAAQNMPGQAYGNAVPMNRCNQCGAMNLINAKYCSQCSSALNLAYQNSSPNQSFCPHCGKGIRQGTIYCSKCGGKVG